MVSPGGSIVSVTVTSPDVGPSPTLPTVIVYVLGCPGASAGACVLPIARSGTSTRVMAGAVATVLGTPVVAAWKASSAVFSIVSPTSKPVVATLTWKLTVALAPGASRPPAPGVAPVPRRTTTPPPANAPRSSPPASVTTAPLRRMLPGTKAAPAGIASLNVVAAAPSWPVFCTVHRVRQRVAEARRRAADGLRRDDPRRVQVGGDRHHARLVGVAAGRQPHLRARLPVAEHVRRPEQVGVVTEVVPEARRPRGDERAGVGDRRVEHVRVRRRGRRWSRVDGIRQCGECPRPHPGSAPGRRRPQIPLVGDDPDRRRDRARERRLEAAQRDRDRRCRRRSASRRRPRGCDSGRPGPRRRPPAPSRRSSNRSGRCRAARSRSCTSPRRRRRLSPSHWRTPGTGSTRCRPATP